MSDWRHEIEPWTFECHECGKEHGYHAGKITCRNCGTRLNP